jgi:hypothetical protein
MNCKDCPNTSIYYGIFSQINGIGVNCDCSDGRYHIVLKYNNDYIELQTLLNDLSKIDNSQFEFCEYNKKEIYNEL